MMGIVCRPVLMLVLAAGPYQQQTVCKLASHDVNFVNSCADARAGCR